MGNYSVGERLSRMYSSRRWMCKLKSAAVVLMKVLSKFSVVFELLTGTLAVADVP